MTEGPIFSDYEEIPDELDGDAPITDTVLSGS